MYEGEGPLPFISLVEALLPPPKTHDLDGCEMIFSDSCFFDEDGKPVFIAKTVGDNHGMGGKLTKFNQPHKLSLEKVRQEFVRIVEERKQDKDDKKGDKSLQHQGSGTDGVTSMNG